ncbi:MAG: RAMP superfamily CRISPR-associated protein [Candidatus Bathyarchaeia archaeon]
MTISHFLVRGVIVTEEPVHIGSGRRTGVIKRSLQYIPGSFIRGTWGTVLVKSVCRLNEPFRDHESCEYASDCRYIKLFDEGGQKDSNIFFRYAYPLHLKCGGVFKPAPLTMHKCESSQCGEVYDTFEPPERCRCDSGVKPYSGFVCDKCGEMNPNPIRLERITSTAIDRVRGAAAMIDIGGDPAGTLHTLEAIPKGSRFRLEALIHRNLSHDIQAIKSIFEKGLQDEGLGGSRSRGFGKISIKDLTVEPVDIELFEKRVEDIDVKLFSIRAITPIILDKVLDSRILLEAARRAYSWVFHEGKPSLPDLELEKSRINLEHIGGWSQKEDKQRRIEQAIAAGSIFQFRCGKGDDLLAKALAALEAYPIGGKKPYGCGHLKVERAR